MINFLKFKKYYFGLSLTIIVVSLLSLAAWGLKPSIDFVGGALYEFKIPNQQQEVGSDQLRESLSQVSDLNISTIQYSQSSNSYILRTNNIDENKKNEVKTKLGEKFSTTIEELRFETVGPTLGRELLIKTGFAALIASLLIMIYVSYQFKDKIYGISAIIAMIHDVIVLVGSFSLLGHFLNVEVDTLFVTALLTTLSFSVHDTIVVFDRIREAIGKNSGLQLEGILNKAVTQTFPRSLNNSLTIIFMLTCLFLLGGATIKWFVVALLIGTISGTYSSPFIAVPVLHTITQWQNKRKKK